MVMMEEENSGYILTAILCYFCCCLILYDVTICIKVLDNVKQLFHKMMLLKIIICRHEKKTQKICDVSQKFPEQRYVRLHDERSMAGINQGYVSDACSPTVTVELDCNYESHCNEIYNGFSRTKCFNEDGHKFYEIDPTEILVSKYTRYVNENDNDYPSINLFGSYGYISDPSLSTVTVELDSNYESHCNEIYNGFSRTKSVNDDGHISHVSDLPEKLVSKHTRYENGNDNGYLSIKLFGSYETCRNHIQDYPKLSRISYKKENDKLKTKSFRDDGRLSHIRDLPEKSDSGYTRNLNGKDNAFSRTNIFQHDETRLYHIPDRQDNSKCSWTVYKGGSEKVRTRSFHDDAFIRLCILLSQLKNGFLENIMNLKFEQVTLLWINRGIKYTLLWLNSLITGTLWQLLDVVFGSNETNVRQGMRNIYLLFLHECRKEAKRVRLFGIKSTNMGRIVKSEKDFVPRPIISEKCFVYKTSVFETNCDDTCRLKSFKIILMSRPEICVLQRFTQDWKHTVCRGWKSQFKSNKSQSNDGETSIEMNLQDTSGPVSMKTKGEIKKQKYLQLTNTTKCQLCTNRNRAVNWCNTCQMNICSFCKLYHQRVWDVMDHDIHPLRETY